jgi:hypothetical protein
MIDLTIQSYDQNYLLSTPGRDLAWVVSNPLSPAACETGDWYFLHVLDPDLLAKIPRPVAVGTFSE